ncbi:MAG: class I SAM-dependent methyltransferase [Candidatus Krumholzibacteria bacterium]|nr:class I SAM-dependent methyltransferase [Candidatus Krumholzibacteria bacterium]
MQRILEPELMEDDAQARAYAEADFEVAHASCITHFQQNFQESTLGRFVLDLGCGPGDISVRFARAYPTCIVHGVDGSKAMLGYGVKTLAAAKDVRERIKLIHGFLPGATLPRSKYDIIISNSLLHHLPDPGVLWQTVREYALPGSPVFVMDVLRPRSPEQARALVETYAGDEPDILQRDFYNSLLAGFEIDEIRGQLARAGLEGFSVEQVSDRHVIIAGRGP